MVECVTKQKGQQRGVVFSWARKIFCGILQSLTGPRMDGRIVSGNKYYGATQIHTETINLNGEEGGSKFDPERNQSRASNKGIRPPIQASQDYQEGRDRYSPGRTDLQARSSERGAAAVCGGSGGEEEDYGGAEPGERRVRRRRVRCPPPPPARTKTSRGREPAGEAGKHCQRAELERVAEPLGKPVLNLT